MKFSGQEVRGLARRYHRRLVDDDCWLPPQWNIELLFTGPLSKQLKDRGKHIKKWPFCRQRGYLYAMITIVMREVVHHAPGPARAQWFHRCVDQYLVDQGSCRRGCFHCCCYAIVATKDEAELLASSVDRSRVDHAAKYEPNPEYIWWAPEDESRCVFLTDDNDCQVYDHRPLSCRLFSVTSAPEFCRSGPGSRAWEAKQVVSSSIGANLIASTAFMIQDHGYLPRMLQDELRCH